jgi:streptogramin lyase
VPCGYGISVDSVGRVWTGGWGSGEYSCVNRYDPITDENQYVNVPGASFLRGIAVGLGASAGYVWAADTGGSLVKIDKETVQVAGMFNIGGSDMIGVAIDFEGNVWTVAQGSSSAYKFDPVAETHVAVPIGMNPYTYSDMTGAQLKNVIDPE